MTLPDFLQSVADAIKEKTGRTEKIKPINFPSEIRSISGGGGSSDLIDVETFPTTNVQDDKVYRSEVEVDSKFEIYIIADGETISFTQLAAIQGLNISIYETNTISEVENPIETDMNTTNWYVYIENSTGFAYLYVNIDGTSPQWKTFGEMDGDPSLNKGFTTDITTETENGYYVYKQESGTLTAIGVPNANDDKKVFTWNGEKWNELKAIKIVKNIPTVGETGMLYFREKVPYPCATMDNGVLITWSEFAAVLTTGLGGGLQLSLEQVIICDELPTENIIEMQTEGLYGEVVFTHYALKSNDTWQIWKYTSKDGWEQFTGEQFSISYFNEAWIWNGIRFVKVWREDFFFTDEVVNNAEFIYENPSYVGELSVIKPKIGDLYEHEPDYSIVEPKKEDTTYIVKDLYSDFANYKYTSQFTVIGYGTFAVEKDVVMSIFNRTSTVFDANSYSYNYKFNPPDYCFYHYTNLQTIYLQSGMTSIGEYAFAECSNLTSIVYDGTKSAWKSITKGENWDLNTGNYIITCTDGTIAKDGTET